MSSLYIFGSFLSAVRSTARGHSTFLTLFLPPPPQIGVSGVDAFNTTAFQHFPNIFPVRIHGLPNNVHRTSAGGERISTYGVILHV